MSVSVDDPSVPIGNTVLATVTATGGTPDYSYTLTRQIADETCVPRAIFAYGPGPQTPDGPPPPPNQFPVPITTAGGHEIEGGAGDSSNPVKSGTAGTNVTGLPPDAVDPDCSRGVATRFHNSWIEVVDLNVTAQGMPMGPGYTAAMASVQEGVDEKLKQPNGQYPPAWTTLVSEWWPARGQIVTTFQWDAENSRILDTKATPPLSQSQITDLENNPGLEFYKQRQKVRLWYTEGCREDNFPSGYFEIKAVSTGDTSNGNQGLVDFID